MLFLGLSFFLLALFKMAPVDVFYGKNYIIYKTSEDPKILIFTFFLIFLNTSGIIGTFFYQGLKSKKGFVRNRAFMFAGGGILVSLGMVVNILLLKPMVIFYSVILASIFVLPGVFLIVKAVLLKRERV